MSEKLQQLIEESIALELNMADLYMFFFRTFSEDKDLWWQLVIEEQNHAALIEGGRDSLIGSDGFPEEILASDANVLKEAKRDIKKRLEQFSSREPTREEAFNLALKYEEAAGEAHFQKQMKGASDNLYIKIFQQLNQHDIDHAARIRSYMESKGIKVIT